MKARPVTQNLPPETLAEVERAFNRQTREDLCLFVQRAFHELHPGTKYLHNWHISAMCEYLMEVYHGNIRDLIINVPPRSLKSIVSTIAFPAWVLGNNPSKQIMAGSYSAALSYDHSVASRRLMESPWYQRMFPSTILAHDQNTKGRFDTTAGGYRMATSIAGSAVGMGADILIADDPQNPKMAASELERNKANEWFVHSFSTRRNSPDQSSRVLVQQRLHQKDTTGYMLELERDQRMNEAEAEEKLTSEGWTVVKFPLVFEKKTIIEVGKFRRVIAAGTQLHPERFSEKTIAKIKAEFGSNMFAGQYMQEPVAAEGGLWKMHWFKRYGEWPPRFERIIQTWDTAGKGEVTSAYSVCVTIGVFEGKYYILDVFRARLDYPELKRKVAALAAHYKPDAILIEDASSGMMLLQELRISSGLPLIAISPHGSDKETRAAAAAPAIEAGLVLLPHTAPWLYDFETEVHYFPNSDFKDQVDAFAQGLNWLKMNAADRYRIRVL